MSDLAIHPFYGDIATFKGSLVMDDSILTGVLLSLFSDAEWPALHKDERRGWWGDCLAEDGEDRLGSLLWLRRQRKLTTETATLIRGDCEAALAWMVKDGVARSVAVTAEIQKPDRVALRIVLGRPDGQSSLIRFSLAWAASLEAGVFDQNEREMQTICEIAGLLEFEFFEHYPGVAG